MEFQSFNGGAVLSQIKYVSDLLLRTDMSSSSPMSTLVAVKHVPTFADGEPVDVKAFRHIMRALQYLTFTRPDITFVVNQVCQHFNSPTRVHLLAAKRILRYLRGTQHYGLWYMSQSPVNFYAFCDTDWAGCPTMRRFATGIQFVWVRIVFPGCPRSNQRCLSLVQRPNIGHERLLLQSSLGLDHLFASGNWGLLVHCSPVVL